MTKPETIRWLLREYGLFVQYSPMHREIAGSLTAGIVLAFLTRQFAYHNRDKIFETDKAIMAGTSLTENELRAAKVTLKGLPFLGITREGTNGQTNYQMDWDAYVEFCVSLKARNVDLTNQKAPDSLNPRDPYKENTKKENTLTHPAGAGNGSLLPPVTSSNPTKPTPPAQKPTSTRFQKTYIRLWEKKYQGKTYPFKGGQDGKHFKSLFAYFKGDRTPYKSAVQRYFACDEKFFAGHPVSKLVMDLARWIMDGPAEQELNNANNTTVGIVATEEVAKFDIRDLMEDEE